MPNQFVIKNGLVIQSGGISNTGNMSITGSLNVSGNVTAKEFHTTFVSSSIIFSSGSTKFGDTSNDKHMFTGSLYLNTQTAATSDTDKFLVFDTNGQIKYRTGAQVLSDIGGQASGNYVDLTSNQNIGGNKTFTANTTFGNASTDTVTFTAKVNSNIIPEGTPPVVSLGDASSRWLTIFGEYVNTKQLFTSGSSQIVAPAGGKTEFTGSVAFKSLDSSIENGKLLKLNSNGVLVSATEGIVTPVQTYIDFKGLTSGGMPWGGTTDVMPIDRWMGVWIAPTSGYIEKVYVSPENLNPTQDQFSIQLWTNGTAQGTPQSQLLGAPGVNVAYTFGSSNYSFNANDRIHLNLNKNTNSSDFYAIQVVFRLNN